MHASRHPQEGLTIYLREDTNPRDIEQLQRGEVLQADLLEPELLRVIPSRKLLLVGDAQLAPEEIKVRYFPKLNWENVKRIYVKISFPILETLRTRETYQKDHPLEKSICLIRDRNL